MTKVYVVLNESVAASLLKDAGSFVVIAGLISVGWLLDIEAMEWVGAVIGFLVVLGRATTFGKTYFRGGPKDAITFIENIERGEIE